MGWNRPSELDQDPVFDHTNGKKITVTTESTAILTTPADCRYVHITASANVLIRTDGEDAADGDNVVEIIAGAPMIIPAISGKIIKGIVASGTSIVRCMPMKAR